MTLGSGIAIAGIWGAVAVVGLKEPLSIMVSGLFALIATLAIVSK